MTRVRVRVTAEEEATPPEAEKGEMWPRVRELQEPPAAGRGKELFTREPPKEVWSCRHLDFRLLVFKTVGEYISIVLSHAVCGNCYSSLWKLIPHLFPHTDVPFGSCTL